MTADAPPPAAPSHAGSRRPVWLRVLLWTVAAAFVLAVAVVVWFVAMLSGGLDDLFGDPRTPDDPAVVAAYERTRPKNEAALDRTVAGLDRAGLPVEVLGSAQSESCRQGQHNWKIDDPFDLWCSLTDSTLLVAGTLPGFRADMVALDAHLTAQGWTGDHFDIPYVLTGYWDDRVGIEAANPGWSYPYGMPSVGYTRGEEGLDVDWAVHGQAGWSSGVADEWVDAAGDRAALEALAAQVPDGSYGLVVTMTRDYFLE